MTPDELAETFAQATKNYYASEKKLQEEPTIENAYEHVISMDTFVTMRNVVTQTYRQAAAFSEIERSRES